MRVLSKLLTFSCWITLSHHAALAADGPPPLTDPLRQVVESELAFAHRCSEIGISKSFTQFFANDGIVFVKGPTNGKKFYAKYNDHGSKLIWQPVFATVAASGELGLTTGPWQLSKSARDAKPIAFGQFASLWKKQADNSWKVIVDLGVDNPQPTEEPANVQFLPPDTGAIDQKVGRESLQKAEKALDDMMRDGLGRAVTACASKDIRVLRDGAFPAIGKDAAKLMLASEAGHAARKTQGGKIATSADFAYRYGTFMNERGNKTISGHFLSVWRLEDSEWKIVLDLEKKGEKTSKPN
jgi:ketosteroid isomerase-like protein